MKLHTLFEHLTLGPVTSYTNLSFVPVFGPDAIKDDLLLVDEALRTGYFTVTDSGQISLLLADNRFGMKIFVPSGATSTPLDDFDGLPIRMSADETMLYSVGEDFVDDGGDANKDVVFPLRRSRAF